MYPRDIEEVAAAIRRCARSRCSAFPHDKWGETPVAAVVLREAGSEAAEVLKRLDQCARRRARYQRLDRVIVMDDFPRNAAGKTLKREMRAPFWAGRERKI